MWGRMKLEINLVELEEREGGEGVGKCGGGIRDGIGGFGDENGGDGLMVVVIKERRRRRRKRWWWG